MALTINSEIRDVHGITPEQEAKILDFLQGAVYCWCNNQSTRIKEHSRRKKRN